MPKRPPKSERMPVTLVLDSDIVELVPPEHRQLFLHRLGRPCRNEPPQPFISVVVHASRLKLPGGPVPAVRPVPKQRARADETDAGRAVGQTMARVRQMGLTYDTPANPPMEIDRDETPKPRDELEEAAEAILTSNEWWDSARRTPEMEAIVNAHHERFGTDEFPVPVATTIAQELDKPGEHARKGGEERRWRDGTTQPLHARWRKQAKEIWKRSRDLSAARVAQLICADKEHPCDHAANTIRQVISPLKPGRKARES